MIWRRLGAVVPAWILLTIALGWFYATVLDRTGLGFFFAGFMAAAGIFLIRELIAVGANSIYARMGAEAERWTASELRKLGRRWRVYNFIEFDRCDVDHVVVGPNGVAAVETKWRVSRIEQGGGTEESWIPEDFLADAHWAADKIRLLLLSKEIRQPVTPVLVVWGPAIPRIANGRCLVDGVHVLDGHQAKIWRRAIRNAAANEAPDADVQQALAGYLSRRRGGQGWVRLLPRRRRLTSRGQQGVKSPIPSARSRY